MNWFKRKNKEEKIDLQKEEDILTEKYKNEINSYCKIANYIFILKGFKHDDKYVCVKFIDKDTPKDYIMYLDIYWFSVKYGHNDFSKMRYEFVVFKRDLEEVGLKLEKI